MKSTKNNQSVSNVINQLIRYYEVPSDLSGKDALDAVIKKINQKKKAVDRKQKLYGIITGASAAAVAVILVTFWIFTATITKSTTDGETFTCRLPDESRVVLKENSTIQFKKYNWNRKVKLNGEAYFEIEKGDGFQVITEQGKVEVLGTRFLVSDVEKQFSVLCFEGLVKTSFNEKSWILEPHTKFNSENGKAGKEEFDENKNFPEFATFQRQFNGEELKDVIQGIESFFNVEIRIRNGKYKKFSGSIQSGSLESTLHIISESMQMNYHFIEDSKIILSD